MSDHNTRMFRHSPADQIRLDRPFPALIGLTMWHLYTSQAFDCSGWQVVGGMLLIAIPLATVGGQPIKGGNAWVPAEECLLLEAWPEAEEECEWVA